MEASALRAGSRTFDLGPASVIPLGEGKLFEVAGLAVAIFRSRTGELYAAQAACPHRRGPLADGLLGGTLVICPLHGFRFDLSTGQPVGNDCKPIETYRVELGTGGEILLTLEPRHSLEPRH